jgi:hypothetical protein
MKEHYAYEKNGSCTLLAAIEPLTGQRLGLVRAQRTKKEYTEFCQALVKAWPEGACQEFSVNGVALSD